MDTEDAEYSFLFVYGQLQPGHRFPIEAEVIRPDRVRGLLYDLGEYPGAVEIGKADNWFSGFLATLPTEDLDELDRFECVEDGLYRRIQTETESGVTAWIYEYLQTLPEDAFGPIDAWPVDPTD
ncbi:MAG: gamma-glutamylcyclotransferase [Planctomycetaceae bacterium]|nr:gamma-glutamylcyclotransferase [Planctomycetaceae bacterium]